MSCRAPGGRWRPAGCSWARKVRPLSRGHRPAAQSRAINLAAYGGIVFPWRSIIESPDHHAARGVRRAEQGLGLLPQVLDRS